MLLNDNVLKASITLCAYYLGTIAELRVVSHGEQPEDLNCLYVWRRVQPLHKKLLFSALCSHAWG